MFQRTYNPILIAVALALITIGGTYLYAKSKKGESESVDVPNILNTATSTYENVRGIQPGEHILGNPNAKIIFFVYSDFSCPYCKDYHETLKTVMKLHGSGGDVAVVFRHMPFVQLHPESPMYALASECVTKELGNVGFWKFADLLFTKTDPLDPIGAAGLVVFAESIGASKQTFVACMRANEMMTNIERDFQEGMNAGAQGSPYTIFQMNGERTVFEGAQSYRTLGTMIQTALRTSEIDGVIKSPSEATEGEQSFVNDFYLYDETSTTSTSTPKSTSTSTGGDLF
jgi:protein-disulfide isomerase